MMDAEWPNLPPPDEPRQSRYQYRQPTLFGPCDCDCHEDQAIASCNLCHHRHPKIEYP